MGNPFNQTVKEERKGNPFTVKTQFRGNIDIWVAMNPDWFETRQVKGHLYLTTEHHFLEGNRCNIWLLKGKTRDVIIDTGLGVCNLRWHLEQQGLIDPPGEGSRDVIVVLTHVHFDHSGGAHHFEKVYIHPSDIEGLRRGRQSKTLNYVKPLHFDQLPYQGFSACGYKVPPTECLPIREGDTIDLGGGEKLEIMHFPGHTAGSIAVYNPHREELFTGDIVYECGSGNGLLDWLPTSKVNDYMNSAIRLSDWLSQHPVPTIYPGHFGHMTAHRVVDLLQEYLESRSNVCCASCSGCMQCGSWVFIVMNCFRCCPC